MAAEASSRSSPIDKVRSIPYKELGKRFYREFKNDDVMGLGAEVAYHLIFAIPPLIILVVTVAAALNEFTTLPVAENLQDVVEERAPESLREVLTTIIENAVAQASGGLISIGLLTTAVVAIWSGSNGIGSIMKAYNRAYDVEESRPYIKKKLVAIGLTLLMVVLINAAFALFVFGESIGAWVANWLGMGDVFRTFWELVRWPLAIFLFMFLLAVLYYLAPNVEQSFQWISPGSVAATILWIGAVFAFRFYLNYASPGSAYGAFSSVIVFIFFLFITSIVLLIGAEVNAILQRKYDESVVRDRAEHPEKLESDEARDDATREADEMSHREGRQVSNRASATRRHRAPDVPAGNPRSTRPRGAGLAVVGTIAGWLLGRRAQQNGHHDGRGRSGDGTSGPRSKA